MTRRDLPNLITLIRILLIAPLIWALAADRYGVALLIFVVAGGSDGIDGYLARRYHWQSPLGALLDPIADKLLLVTIFLGLATQGFVPGWLVAAVLARDLIILAGAGAYRMLFAELEVVPSLLSKLNTVLQIALVVTALAGRGLHWLPDAAVEGLIWVVAFTTFASGTHYVLVWSRRAWRQGTGKEKS